MKNEKIEIIYEDENILVIDKPAGIIVYPEEPTKEKTLNCGAIAHCSHTAGSEATGSLIDSLLEKLPSLKKVGKPPRYGIVHRLDKDTSGILLVAKNNKTLDFLQKQFKTGEVLKKYLALITGNLKTNRGTIETLIGRAPKNRKKQKAYSLYEPEAKRRGLRRAITEYKALERFSAKGGSVGGGKDYTLVEASPKTGRRHQIRCHLSYLGHPIVADIIYGFKNQPRPKNLKRHFLHANYLKIKLPNGKEKEFKSELPEDLLKILNNLD